MRSVTVVTGGSRGIGRAVVHRLAAHGHEVVNISRSVPTDELPAVTYTADLSAEDEADHVMQIVTNRHDVDNLVNNAAAIRVANIEQLSFADFDHLVALNLRAALRCIQAVVPGMKGKHRGRIVNLGSRASLGKAGRTVYSMTKAGIVGMSRSLALELAESSITVNVVSPGPIETEMFWSNSRPDDPTVKALIDAIPIGRMGRPEDVAAAIGFLLSDDASFITGQNLYVCGGLSLVRPD